MMKNNDISRRDWESLSAYIDGQLNPTQSARLEERLQARADLRAALESLRRTQTILRSRGNMRAPRNFTLAPEMAGVRVPKPKRAPLFPVFRLASALASILLVLVLFGDFLVGGSLGPMSRTANEAAPLIVTVEVEREAEKMEEPQLQMQAEVKEEAAEGEMPEESRAMQLPAGTSGIGGGLDESQAVTEAAVPEAEMVQPTEAPLEMEAGPPPSEIPAAPATSEEQADQTYSSTPGVVEQTQIAATQREEQSFPPDEELPLRSILSPWRVVEIVLAGIALVSGLIAFYLRRVG